jgi:hypothetical protein
MNLLLRVSVPNTVASFPKCVARVTPAMSISHFLKLVSALICIEDDRDYFISTRFRY